MVAEIWASVISPFVDQWVALKLKLENIHRYTPITLYPTLPFYNIIIIFDTVVTQKRNIEHEKQ